MRRVRRVHLDCNYGGGEGGGPDPDAQVGGDMILAGSGTQNACRRGCRDRQKPRAGKGGRAVAAKLGGMCHLPANAADVA